MKKEVMENLFDVYSLGNPPQIRNVIQGWERESNSKEEDIEVQVEMMDFVSDATNTRGRLSLLHQYIHTYLNLKCVLEKSLQSLKENEGSPKVVSILQEIKKEIQDTRVS